MSFDRLIRLIDEKQNPTVVGLDPKLDYIPEDIRGRAFREHGQTLRGAAQAVLEFNKGLIDALADLIPAVKPQVAYYEQFGWEGMRVFAETVEYAQSRGLFVIADGKRNDIGSTSEAYATAFLGKVQVGDAEFAPFGADALTVNGYLGSDGVEPFVESCRKYGKGIFVLAKTSNPSSGELQDCVIDGEPVYKRMGGFCRKWGAGTEGAFGYGVVGAVVGATYPEQLREMRVALPEVMFLVPGYGAQGGAASDIVGAFDRDGRGAVVNSSRAILCAWMKNTQLDYRDAARAEAQKMRDEIRKALTAR